MLAVRAVEDLIRTESGQTIVLPKVFYSDVIVSSYNPHHAAAAVIADGDTAATSTTSSNACSSSSAYYCTTGLLPQVGLILEEHYVYSRTCLCVPLYACTTACRRTCSSLKTASDETCTLSDRLLQ
jgi:hypothetical protein